MNREPNVITVELDLDKGLVKGKVSRHLAGIFTFDQMKALERVVDRTVEAFEVESDLFTKGRHQ